MLSGPEGEDMNLVEGGMSRHADGDGQRAVPGSPRS